MATLSSVHDISKSGEGIRFQRVYNHKPDIKLNHPQRITTHIMQVHGID